MRQGHRGFMAPAAAAALAALVMLSGASAQAPTPSEAAAESSPPKIRIREETLPVTERLLDNGLRLLVYERPDASNVACRIVYNVGSADEWAGVTGLSHFSEHLMFKGTARIGTADFAREVPLLKREDDLRETLQLIEDDARRLAESGDNVPEAMLRRIAALRAQADRTSKELAALGKSAAIDALYTRVGGGGLNANTGAHRTEYTVELPPNRLELFFWVEADRMANSVSREFYSERDVVIEERRMAVENQVIGRQVESLFNSMCEGGGYATPVVGWPSDMARYTRPLQMAYRQRFYRPDNATIVLVGAVKPNDAHKLAQRYFGPLAKPVQPLKRRGASSPEDYGSRTLTSWAPFYPAVALMWRTPGARHRDAAALELLGALLNGRSGPMARRFVDTGEAVQPMLLTSMTADTGLFGIGLLLAGDRDPQGYRRRLDDLLEEIRLGGIANEDFERAQAAMLRDKLDELDGNEAIADMLVEGAIEGDWREPFRRAARAASLTPDDVANVARIYLPRERATAALIYPAPPVASEPALAPLPALPAINDDEAAHIAAEAISECERRFPREHFDARAWYDALAARVTPHGD